MTDQELKNLVASLTEDTKALTEAQRQTDEQMRQTDEQMKKTDEKIDRLGKLIGNISNNQGDDAEEFFFNTLRSKMKIGDISFGDISPNVYKERGSVKDEYNILLTNGNSIAIVETKYKAHPNDLEKLKDKKIPNFRKLFPVYKDFVIYAGIASFNINKQVERKAEEYGFFVLKRKGDIVETDSTHMRGQG